MYFPTFFPTVPRPFEGRPLGMPVDMPTVLSGREREIPLDLSIKTVRQPGEAVPEEYLLLDQRKYLGLGGPGNFLDFRLPYRMDVPYPFCAAAASPIGHSAAVMSSLLQRERERCLESVCPRTGHPVGPFLDPALSLHLRNGAAAALAPQATRTPQAGPNFFAPLGVIPTSAGSYPLFSDFLHPTAERRPDTGKGAFTSVQHRSSEKASPSVSVCSSSTTSSSFMTATTSSCGGSASSLVSGLEARYAEHLQRLREAKCTASCCSSLATTPTTSSITSTSTGGAASNCACCLQPGSSSICRKDCKGTSPYMGLVPPSAAATGDLRMSSFCTLPEVAPLFAPVSAAASTGVWSPASKMVSVASPAQKRKEGVAQKESPRAARDFPSPAVVTASTVASASVVDVKPVISSQARSHREPEVMIIEEKKHRTFASSAFSFNRTPSPTLKRSSQLLDVVSTTPTPTSSLTSTVTPTPEVPPPAKMPRLEAASSARPEPPTEPWSPAGPPPLLPAVVTDVCRPLFGDFNPDPSSYGKLVMRLPKKVSAVPYDLPTPSLPFVAKSEVLLPSSDSSFTSVVATSASVPSVASPAEIKSEPILTSTSKRPAVVDVVSNSPPSPPHPVIQQPIFFPATLAGVVSMKEAASLAAPVASPAMPNVVTTASVPERTPEEQAEEAKRQRALQLYSDLSEIDQQDKDGQKAIRLREPVEVDTTNGLVVKSRQHLDSVHSASHEVQRKTDSPATGSPTAGITGASAVEEGLRQEALRLADARAKKRLRRRLLARLYQEKTAGNSDDDTESQEDDEDDDDELDALKGDDDDVAKGVDGINGDDDKQPLERRLLSQLNLSWRQRRLLYSCRRRRFRSGLDMIHRRPHRKRSKPAPPSSSSSSSHPADDLIDRLDAAERQRMALDAVTKVSSEGGAPIEMKRLMVNKALGETILHRAARQSYLEVVLYCLETKCCDVNARDNAGYTPLHECCSRGHLEAARSLLQYGADVNASAAGGIRPLHDAVENDHVECVRLLLSYGADPTIATYSGLSPVKLSRSPIMTEFLRGYMADISGDTDGHPVLPWQFRGTASCLDPSVMGYNVLEGVPSDEEASAAEGEGEEPGRFLFEVSDSPLLPSFRLYLPPPASGTGHAKVLCNCLRLSDVLKQTGLSKEDFRRFYGHLELVTVPRHEFEAGAACSQLLTGTRLDALLATSASDEDPAHIDVLRLDNQLRSLLGIETITLR